MCIDNFKRVTSLLDFSEPNTFYLIHILKRRKENPDMKAGVKLINSFYLYQLADLSQIKDKIIETCQKNNARAYLKVNKLDLKRVALLTSKKIIELIIQGNYRAVKKAYLSVCTTDSSQKDKRWIVDLDTQDQMLIDQVSTTIKQLHQETTNSKNYKILAELPTKNGIHLITNPFNLKKFKDRFPDIEVHKSGLTVLFIPKTKNKK